MAGFDTTNVAATVGQGVNQFNPIQTVEGLAATQNMLNQNRLFQSQQAAGQAFQGSIDPTTGQFSQNAFMGTLAGDPRAALAAQEAATRGAMLQGQGLANQTTAQALGARQIDYLRTLAGTLAQSPNLNPDAINTVIDSSVQSGAVSPQVAAAYRSTMPTDPAALKAWATSSELNSLGPQGALDAVAPKAVPISTGGVTALETTPNIGAPATVGSLLNTPGPSTVTVNNGAGTRILAVTPSTGSAAQVGATIPQQLSPSEKIARVPTVVNGVPTSVPVASLAGPTGEPTNIPGVTGTGGSLVSGYTPAQQASGTAAGGAVGQQSGGYFANIQTAGSQAPAQQASLEELDSLLADPKVQTGPGSPFLSKINAMAQQFGIPIDPKWASDTSKLDVFNKIATQIAQQQFGVIGGTGTDAKLMSAAHTSPDQMISSLSNRDIIPLLRGNASAAQHVAAAANMWLANHGNDPATGPQFQAVLQQHYNPLVFQTQYMDPAERANIIANLPAADRAKYQQDWEYAYAHKWITP